LGGQNSSLFKIVKPIHLYHQFIFYKENSSELRDEWMFNKKNEEGEQIIDVRFESPISTESIKSMILDVFSFNMSDFNTYLEGYDFCDDIKKPTEVKPWLVRDINPKDLIVF
jgi:hypothetical protein